MTATAMAAVAAADEHYDNLCNASDPYTILPDWPLDLCVDGMDGENKLGE